MIHRYQAGYELANENRFIRCFPTGFPIRRGTIMSQVLKNLVDQRGLQSQRMRQEHVLDLSLSL